MYDGGAAWGWALAWAARWYTTSTWPDRPASNARSIDRALLMLPRTSVKRGCRASRLTTAGTVEKPFSSPMTRWPSASSASASAAPMYPMPVISAVTMRHRPCVESTPPVAVE